MSSVIDADGRLVPRAMTRKLECGAVLALTAAPDVLYGYVEASAPKLVGSDNVRPLALVDARDAVAVMVEEAQEFVSWADPVAVNRLDVARDFTGCDDVGPLLLALSSVPLKGRKVRDLYRDPAAGAAETLFVRNRGGGCRLYDKHEESRVELARGRVRCESQERRRGLRARGVSSWEALREVDVMAVGRARYEWAGFDRTITREGGAVARLLASTTLTDGQRLQALGALLLAQHGQWDRIGDRNRRSRMRATLEEFDAFASVVDLAPVRFDYVDGLIAA